MLELLKKLVEYNISIWLDGDNLELSFGEEAPDEMLIDSLRENKPEIIKELFN